MAVAKAMGQLSLATGMALTQERIGAIVAVLQRRGVTDAQIIYAANQLSVTLKSDYAKSISAADFLEVIEGEQTERHTWSARQQKAEEEMRRDAEANARHDEYMRKLKAGEIKPQKEIPPTPFARDLVRWMEDNDVTDEKAAELCGSSVRRIREYKRGRRLSVAKEKVIRKIITTDYETD